MDVAIVKIIMAHLLRVVNSRLLLRNVMDCILAGMATIDNATCTIRSMSLQKVTFYTFTLANEI